VSESVGDVGDQTLALTFRVAEKTVNGLDDDLDEVDVLPFIEAADVVGVGGLTLVEDEVDGAGMVLHVQPVAHVLTLAVDGKWFAVAYIVDEEGYQFLRELVRSVVVGAVGHDRRHTVGVVVGTDKVVGGCLRRAVWRMGIVFGLLGEEEGTIRLMFLSA